MAYATPAAAQNDLNMPPGLDGGRLILSPENGDAIAPDSNGSSVIGSSSGDFPSVANGGTFSSAGTVYSPLLGAHMRARYNTQSYGQSRGNLDLGTMRLYDLGDASWFLDAQLTLNDENTWGYNIGAGYRFLTLPVFPFSPDAEKLAGISFWTDGMKTVNDNFIPAIGLSLEYLGDRWDVRSNLQLALEDTLIGEFTPTGDISYSDTFIVTETMAGVDEALSLTEIELARRLGDLEAWGFVGAYGLYGDETDTGGYKIGLRGYATPDVALQFAVTDDDVFGTNAVFSGTWFIGRTRTNTPTRPTMRVRMREPVIRNDYIAVNQSTITGGAPLTADLDGDGDTESILVVHVDSTAADGGDGSFEAPLNELVDVDGASANNSIVLVHGGSTFTDDTVVLKDGQRLLGEGADIEHTVATDEFGTILLPETAAGAQAGAIPVVTNTMGDVVTLADGTTEVSNLDLQGGDRGIVAPAGSLDVNINNMTIADMTGDGIVLTPASELLNDDDPDSLQVTFTPTISDVTFANIGGDDINIDATSPEAASVPVVEQITISDVTSTGGTGIGINLANNSSAVTITDYSHDGGGAAAGGILITNADGQVAVTDADIMNEGGFGVSIVDSEAGHVLSDVNITDTTGDAFHVNGGTTNAGVVTSFTGTITQSDAGSAVRIEGGHGGTITFAESVTDQGVVNATNGDGLQFDDADGSYTFFSAVTLNGGDAGIDILNDSEADITLVDATITDPTGAAVNVVGGSASLNYTGMITQSNAATTISVTGEHTGTLTFNELDADTGVINATNGDGLVFNQADGAYTFNHAVVLDGTANAADTGLDIIDSDGVFTFDDATITSPTGIAVDIQGGANTMALNYTGTVTQDNAAAALSVTGGNEGTVTFLPNADDDPSIVATNGPGLVFDDADGDYAVLGEMTLDGTANGADTKISITNDSDGTFNFAEATITDPTGTALIIDGGDADVTFTGMINQSNNALAVSVTNHSDQGSLTINEFETDAGSINATNGDGLLFSDADGVYSFNDAVVLDGSANAANTAIDIISDSEGTFTFADTTITDPTGVAFNVEGGSATATFTGLITQSNAASAVSISGGHDGSVIFSEAEADTGVVVATNGDGLQFDNADGVYSFNDAVTLNGGDAGVDILNGSDGTFTFADATITDPTGTAFNVDGGEADVTFTGLITQGNAASAVSVTGGHDGAMTFNESEPGDGVVVATNGDGLQFNNADGAYNFNDAVTLDGGDAGIDILNGSSGTFTFASASEIINPTGNGLVVESSDATVTYAGTIENNAGNSVVLLNNSGGSVTVTGDVTDTGLGVLVQGNTGGSYSLTGNNDLNTGANTAVTVLNNTGTTITFSDLDITTTTGNGFDSENSEGVSVIGSGNTITTTGGVALRLVDTEVDIAGITFDSVSADGGTNGIVMDNVTGGTVEIGASGANVGDGGVVQNTTGDGILLTNVENASFNFMQVTGTGGDGVSLTHDGATSTNVTVANSTITNTTLQGFDADASGSGTFTLVLDDMNINGTTAEGASINVTGATNTANVTMSDSVLSNTNNDEALIVTGDTGTLNLLLADSTFNGDSAAASTVDITASGTALFNTTVTNNIFNNADTTSGQPIQIESATGNASIRLALFDNTATSGVAAGDDYFLVKTAGSFSIENLTVPAVPPDEVPELTVDQSNGGTINYNPSAGDFTTDPGNIPTP